MKIQSLYLDHIIIEFPENKMGSLADLFTVVPNDQAYIQVYGVDTKKSLKMDRKNKNQLWEKQRNKCRKGALLKLLTLIILTRLHKKKKEDIV